MYNFQTNNRYINGHELSRALFSREKRLPLNHLTTHTYKDDILFLNNLKFEDNVNGSYRTAVESKKRLIRSASYSNMYLIFFFLPVVKAIRKT